MTRRCCSSRGGFGFPRLCVIALAGQVLASCGEAVPGTAYDLSGQVSAAREEGAATFPLPGARVRFTSDTGHVSETRTGDDGRYAMQVFSDVPFGQVRAEAPGFMPSESSVYFDQPQRRIDLVLRPVLAE